MLVGIFVVDAKPLRLLILVRDTDWAVFTLVTSIDTKIYALVEYSMGEFKMKSISF